MRSRRLLASTLLPFLPVALRAETATPPTTLPDVVVTPTRSAAAAEALPFRVERLEAAEVQMDRMARTTPEALRELPGVNVQKTANGQGSPFLRGFTGYNTLMLVDGIRLNNSTFRSGPNQYWSTVDSFSYDRLEVLMGPAGVAWGSDAVGGTVQAVSPDAFALAAGDGLYGRGHYRVSSAERSHMGRLEGALASDDLAARAGVSLKSFGDVESGGDTGRQDRTGYGEWAADGALSWRFSPRLRLDVVHQSTEQDDVWRTHSTTRGVSYFGTQVGSDLERSLDQRRHLTYARLRADGLPGLVREASATLSWHRQEEREQRIRKDGSGQVQGVDVSTGGIQGQALLGAGAHRITVGADYYRDEVDSFARRQKEAGGAYAREIAGPVADDSSYDLAGVFAQDEVELAPALRGVFGARYTYAAADAGRFKNPESGEVDSLDASWDQATFSARLIGDAAKGVQIYGGASQGFRAPNLSDLTRFDIARSGEVERPAPGLRPEDYLTYELGVRAGHAGGPRGEVVAFHTEISDMVDRVPTGQATEDGVVVRKQNSGEGFVRGVEVSGALPLGGDLTLRGDVTWMEGELDTYATREPVKTTEPFSRIMPVTAHVALRWQPIARAWLEASATLAADQDELSPGDRRDSERIPPAGSPSYEVFAVRGGFEWRPGLNLTLAVDNLLDEEYRSLGSGSNEPGRNVIAAVDVRF